MRLVIDNPYDIEPHTEDDSRVWVLATVIDENTVEIDCHPADDQ